MLAVFFQVLKPFCCFLPNVRQSEQNNPSRQYKLNSMFWYCHSKHTLGETTIHVDTYWVCSLQLNLARKYVCSFVVTKVVIIDLFCFDITENFFETNMDLILWFIAGCIGYCCTAQLTIWLTLFLMSISNILFFINSYSFWIFTNSFCLQRCFVVIEFSGVFFIFFNGFFCLSRKVKEALLISSIAPNLSFLGSNR